VRPALEVADIVRAHGEEFRQAHAECPSVGQKRVLHAIERCRTAALGGHLERCDQCGHERNAYNSCADRHCPKCQSLARAKWLERRQAELLDCEYFHVVFTLPAELATLALQNKRLMYDLLFRATADTLQSVAADPQYLGAQIGFFCILHSWGQSLNFRPHLHCVVPGGSPYGQDIKPHASSIEVGRRGVRDNQYDRLTLPSLQSETEEHYPCLDGFAPTGSVR
jgi:hypothetical protein